MSGTLSAIVWRLAGLAGLALALSAAAPGATPAAETPVVAAASDLQFALPELTAAFAAQSGREVQVAFGSSGNFFRQIREGAPFEMFLSADEAYVQDLAAEGLTEGDGDLYAVGRIAIVVPHGSPLAADGTLQDLSAALGAGRVERFAIANPEHAPYGRRAEEALRHAGLWEAIRDRLILGENVSQAAQFATSGSADGGIIAYSLALSEKVSKLGEHALIPADWHAPLRQRMALLAGASETTRMFYAFVMSKPGRVILNRYGFVLPGEGA
jgi:molybdate transport system substrate-binding protein